MEIILVRHGKPVFPKVEKIYPIELKKWIDHYDNAELEDEVKPANKLKIYAQECGITVCSHLKMSLLSAERLGVTDNIHSHEIFREFELPWSNSYRVKLSLRFWTVFFRVMWFFGYSGEVESFKDAQRRSVQATRKLIDFAQANGSVLFAGHGFVNRYIAKELLARGWKGPKNPGRKYWEFGRYRL